LPGRGAQAGLVTAVARRNDQDDRHAPLRLKVERTQPSRSLPPSDKVTAVP
jgi:hypothetical protein